MFLIAIEPASAGGGGLRVVTKRKTSRSPIIVRKSATAAQMGAKGAA
jgi:hypothetical protein